MTSWNPKSMRVADYIQWELTRGPLHFTLIDPDKQTPEEAGRLAAAAGEAGSNAIMVGGSTGLSIEKTHATVEAIKKAVELPVILFPPGAAGIAPGADAIFFMSMLNSRLRRFLIEEQVAGAPFIKRMGIETLPMGYIVVEPGGEVGRVGRAELVGREQIDRAVDYALAAQFFGMKYVYLEAGSGAEKPVPHAMIRAVKDQIDLPLIVGGGIRDRDTARGIIEAGADVIVTGTLIERVVDVRGALQEILDYLRSVVRRNVERLERAVTGEPAAAEAAKGADGAAPPGRRLPSPGGATGATPSAPPRAGGAGEPQKPRRRRAAARRKEGAP